MFIICFVDFKEKGIPDGIAEDPQFRDTVISYVKKEFEVLKQVDNVIKELLRSEEIDFQKDLGIYAVQFLDKLDSFTIEHNDQFYEINEEDIEGLIQGYRFLHVVECTIFVPILASPKWVKGLIREKDFELQIFAPGFTLEEEKFHLEVIQYDSAVRETLEKMARGRLLILYTCSSELD